MSMYRNDGREHSGVGWRAKPHALNMVRASFWSCDCWQKQQKDFWTVQIYSHHSDKCYKCDEIVLIVTLNVLSGQRCGCQDIHLSRDTLSATEDIQIHRRAASDKQLRKTKTSPQRKLAHGLQTSEKILHPKKEKLQFCSYLSCMSKHLNTEVMKSYCSSHYRPNWKTNPQFFYRLQKCHFYYHSGQIYAVLFCATKYADCSYRQ